MDVGIHVMNDLIGFDHASWSGSAMIAHDAWFIKKERKNLISVAKNQTDRRTFKMILKEFLYNKDLLHYKFEETNS